MRGTSDHIWHCQVLKCKRRELDSDLAEADPSEFTAAMRQGVACAMNADPTRTFWGTECDETWSRSKKWQYGCLKLQELSREVSEVVTNLKAMEGTETVTARELMERLTAKEAGEERFMPTIETRVEGTAPKYPNVYSDGSLKNTKGYFWLVGGAGVWWPGRKIGTITQAEKGIAEFKEHKISGDIVASDPPPQ